MTEQRTIRVANLGTESGVTEAGAVMAEAVCRDVLAPVVAHTPPEMRQALFERFLSGLTGAVIAEIGPERADAVIDAVKLAIRDFRAERQHAH